MAAAAASAVQPGLEPSGVPISTPQRVPPHSNVEAEPEKIEAQHHVEDDNGGRPLRVLTRTSSHAPELPAWKFALILLALCMTVLCMALDNTILAPAIPVITNVFKSLEDIGWYGSAYLVTLCATPLLYGKLYGVFRLKWVFLSAIGLFEVGSLICGVAQNSITLIIGRAIAGIGAAGIFQGALLIIAALVPLEKRPIWTGLIAGMYGIAGVVGPLLGGAFTDHVSWRWCFYINLPLGGIAVVFIVLFLHLPPTHTYKGMKNFLGSIDIPGGIICFLPGVVCLLLALQWGGTKYAWNNARIIALFVLFGVFITLFIVIQFLSGDKATVPVRILKNRSIWGAALYSFGVGSAFFVLVYYLATWFQAIKGVSATKSAIMNLPLILTMTIVIIASGVSVTLTGYYTHLMIASGVLCAIGAGLITTWETDTGHAKWIGYQAIFGIGVGLGFQLPPIVVQTVLAASDISVGTAVILFAQTFGGAISVAIAQNIFTNELVKKMKDALPGADTGFILSIGAGEIRQRVPPEALAAVLRAYNHSLTRAFMVSVAAAVLSLFGAIFVEWKSVKKSVPKKDTPPSTASSDIESHPAAGTAPTASHALEKEPKSI